MNKKIKAVYEDRVNALEISEDIVKRLMKVGFTFSREAKHAVYVGVDGFIKYGFRGVKLLQASMTYAISARSIVDEEEAS